MKPSSNVSGSQTRVLGKFLKREGWALIELISLSGIAITQPLLETVKFNSSGLSQAGATLPIMILFTAIVIIAPALVLWGIELTVGLIFPKFRTRLHNLLLGVLVAIIVFEAVGSKTAFTFGELLGIAVIVGLFFAAIVLKFTVAKTFIRVLAFASPVFGVLFLLSAPIQSILPSASNSASVEIGKPNRVVMIVMDELPTKSLLDGSGKIDAELFPNFASLAADSHWYRNTTTVAPFTQVAVPAIVSGTFPQNPADLATSKNFPNTIFSLLGGSYDVDSTEITAEYLCPKKICPPRPPKSFANITKVILEDSANLWWRFASPGPGATFGCICADDSLKDGLPLGEKFIDGIKPADSPQFNYVHLLTPHAPWHTTPSGQSYSNRFSIPEGLTPELTWSSKETANASRQRHLLQLQAGDAFLGSVVKRLRDIGAYDNSLIVLTADHGVSFKEGSGYRLIDGKNYSDILWVPLFIKEPGNRGGGEIDDRPASTIDILPTMADALDTKIPWKQDGVSLLRAPVARDPRKFVLWPSGISFLAPRQGKYTGFEETAGFSEVLASPATNPGVTTSKRLYAIDGSGGFANLIGTKPDSIVDLFAAAPGGILTNGGDYLDVRPKAKYAPWALLRGGLDGKTQVLIAVAVNGVIQAISQTQPTLLLTPNFSIPLPTNAFIPGSNIIKLYVVRGTPESPSLIPII